MMLRLFRRSKPLRSKRIHREVLNFLDREIDLHRRAYKRTIGLTLQVNGRIKVSAPLTTPHSRIENFLLANRDWIETHLERYRALREAHPPKRYSEGEMFPLLGEELRLTFQRGSRAKYFVRRERNRLVVDIPDRLWDGLALHRPHPEIAPCVSSFYHSLGRAVLTERVSYLSACMGLRPSSLSFRSQKTRWGSCSSRGRISLNWRLVIAPALVSDYVVAHELAHLKHYNHSAAFWRLVESQIPDFEKCRLWLRRHQFDGDFLAKRSELYG